MFQLDLQRNVDVVCINLSHKKIKWKNSVEGRILFTNFQSYFKYQTNSSGDFSKSYRL